MVRRSKAVPSEIFFCALQRQFIKIHDQIVQIYNFLTIKDYAAAFYESRKSAFNVKFYDKNRSTFLHYFAALTENHSN